MIRYHAEELLDDMALLWAHHQALMSGGDGVTYVVSPRWKELANRYDSRPDRFKVRGDGEESISFMDNQEGVVFVGKVPEYLLGQFDDGMIMLP